MSAEWQKKLPSYKRIIFDSQAAGKNKEILEQLKPTAANFTFWDHPLAAKPAVEDIALLQKLVGEDNWSFRQFVEGSNIGLVWLKESRKIILYNLLEIENKGIVQLAGNLYPVRLKALSFAILDSAGTWVEYDTAVEL